jgi:hypothetical protein
MAFSYGFYNSLNHDRRYDATQFSMIFDGIISDGVYATVGDALIVKASELENTVIVQPGRAWFNHTWNYNDSDLLVTSDQSEIVLDRIDALVIDVNSNESYRENSIKWVKGTPSSSPSRPTLTNNGTDHFQYPLCYVYRKADTEIITQDNITNMVGSSECPFVTGILDTVDIDELLLQWQDQWAQFMIEYEKSATDWEEEQQADFKNFYNEFKLQLSSFEQASGNEFSDWFSNVKYVLDGDVAGKLQNEIDEITETEFNRYYSLFTTSTDISDSKDTIVSKTDEATITTKFTTDEDDEIITTTIVMNSGNYDYIKTTTISSTDDGDHIETTYTKRGK